MRLQTTHPTNSGDATEVWQTAVQIVLIPPVPSNGRPIYRFCGKPVMRTT